MTELNDVISSDSTLVLINASTINARGQIAGLAFEPSTGALPAFLATPTHGARGRSSTGISPGRGRNFVLPAHIRQMLRDRLAKP